MANKVYFKFFLFSAIFVAVYSQCSVNIRQQIPTRDPVYFRQSGNGFTLWAPNGPALTWSAGESTFVACTGTSNTLTTGGTRDAPLTCQNTNIFQINGQSQSTDNIGCTNTITGDTINTGTPCTAGGTILNLGFNTQNYGFITYIQSCYNMITGSVIYTRHVLPGRAINHAVIESARPAFKTAGTPAHIRPATSYTQASQLERLTNLLGSAALAATYIFPNSFMARGHLAPDADGIFRSWQFTTYFFTNVAPQWQVVNAGNWLRVENAARAKANQLQEDVLIFTGAHGVMTLPDINGQQVRITLEPGGNIETPKWYWKIIKSPSRNSGIAIMTLNNPFATVIQPNEILCPDICAATGWSNVNYADFSRGRTFCCSVSDFARSVPGVPAEAMVSSILHF